MMRTERRMAQTGLMGGEMWFLLAGLVCLGNSCVPLLFSQFLMTTCLRYHYAACTERRKAQTRLTGGEMWLILAGLVFLGDG